MATEIEPAMELDPKLMNGEPMKSRYCNKSRHMQKECYKRIKENGSMLNAPLRLWKRHELHCSLRLFGFKLCAGHTVVPSTILDISDIAMTPQLINNIRNDVCDQIEYKINSFHLRPFINCVIENLLHIRALYDTG